MDQKNPKSLNHPPGFTLMEIMVAAAILSLVMLMVISSTGVMFKMSGMETKQSEVFTDSVTPIEFLRRDIKLAESISGSSTQINIQIRVFHPDIPIVVQREIQYTQQAATCQTPNGAIACKKLVRTYNNNTTEFLGIIHLTWCLQGAAGSLGTCPAYGSPSNVASSKRFIIEFAGLSAIPGVPTGVPITAVMDAENVVSDLTIFYRRVLRMLTDRAIKLEALDFATAES